MTKLFTISALIFFSSITAQAQDPDQGNHDLEEIIVTGSAILDWEPDIIPAIRLVKKADFMIQQIRIFNDTRKAEQRADEIYKTISNMLKAAENSSTFTLGTGDDVFVKLTAENYQLPLSEISSKEDAEYTDLLVKAPIHERTEPNAVAKEIRDFISLAEVDGRSEVVATGEMGLSIIKPERYRKDVIALIAKDVQQTLSAFGDNYSVRLEGMEYPLLWERQGLATMALYIPYSYTIVPSPN